MVELEHVRDSLDALGLAHSAQALDAHLELAAHEQPTYLSFFKPTAGCGKRCPESAQRGNALKAIASAAKEESWRV